MPSTFTWLDHSEDDRRRLLDILDTFREKETRDELGIGTIRDALADMLFPGISTAQTRARYFLFVPWIYLDLEQRSVTSERIASRARREEIKLIDALLRSDDQHGVIGKESRAKLQRLPSNIYWHGLQEWGIRLFPGSQEQYHRYLDGYYAITSRRRRAADGDDDQDAVAANWHPHLPKRPIGFPDEASLHLTRQEADFLRERILSRCAGTLLAVVADLEIPLGGVAFPWDLPAEALPGDLNALLEHARCFSEGMYGAALLYNLILAELAEAGDLVEVYREELAAWWSRLISRRAALARWDRGAFWAILVSNTARIPSSTHAFVHTWLDLVLDRLVNQQARDSTAVVEDPSVRRLIEDRERALKRHLSRVDNRRARELWRGASGAVQLTFRWPVAQAILQDIFDGLNGEMPHA